MCYFGGLNNINENFIRLAINGAILYGIRYISKEILLELILCFVRYASIWLPSNIFIKMLCCVWFVCCCICSFNKYSHCFAYCL